MCVHNTECEGEINLYTVKLENQRCSHNIGIR